MAKTPKRPRDTNQLAKFIVDLATGDAGYQNGRRQGLGRSSLGRKDGLKGGNARAEKVSATRRREIAKNAALAKWRR
jgi:hypothetical protein